MTINVNVTESGVTTTVTVSDVGVPGPAGPSYTLPVATSSTLGGVKEGANVTIASDGTISASDGSSSVMVQDEGSTLTTSATTLNFTGNGVVASGDGPTKSINITDTTYSVGDGGLTEKNFTAFLKTKVNGIEVGATADQTASEIEAIVSHDNLQGFVANEHIDWTTDQGSTNIHSGNYTDTTYSVGDGGLTEKNFTNALKLKLDGIEAAADVTNTTNVVAALTAGTNVTIASNGTISSVIADNVVDEANLNVSNNPTDGYILTARSGNTGGMTWEATGVNKALFSASDSRSIDITNQVLTTSNFFNSIDYNVGSCFNGTNGRFTAPVAGYYFCSVHVADNSSTSKEVNIRIRKNGQSNTGPLAEIYNQTGDGSVNNHASCIIQCDEDDYIDFEASRMNVMGGVQHKRFIIYLMG